MKISDEVLQKADMICQGTKISLKQLADEVPPQFDKKETHVNYQGKI